MFMRANAQTACSGFPTGSGTDYFYDPSGTYTVPSTTYSSRVYYVNNDLEITGNVVFTDAVLVIDPNVKITVKNSGNLTFAGCHLFACSDMWQGIIIESATSSYTSNDGTLTLTKSYNHRSTIIEDAFKAVEMNGTTSFVTNPSARINQLTVDNTIFNRNFIGIEMDNYAYLSGTAGLSFITTTSNSRENIYAFSIKNSIFSCRDIPINSASVTTLSSWPDINSYKHSSYWTNTSTYYPNNPNVMGNPYIGNYSSTNLKAPYSGEQSDIGININPSFNGYNNNGHYVIGDHQKNTVTGDWNTNIFDNQRLGIYAGNTNIEINNCTFQSPTFKSQTYDGIGILAINQNESPFYINVTNPDYTKYPNSAFYDCQYAIKTENFQDIIVKYCDIRNSKDGVTNLGGDHGVDIGTWRVVQIDVSENKIYNIGAGIVYSATQPYWTSTFQLYILFENLITASNNTIAVSPSGYSGSYSLRDLRMGIDLGISVGSLLTYLAYSGYQSTPCTGGNNYCNPYYVRCNNNNIDYYHNGIKVTGFEGMDVRILNNYIKLGRDDNATYQAGIRVEDCIPYRPNSNGAANGYFYNSTDGNFIHNNTINYYGSGYCCGNCERAAIDVYGGNNFNINCNSVANCIYGIKINGDLQKNTEVFNNTIDANNVFGLALFDDANYGIGGGIIGGQGDATHASDNHWTGTWVPSSGNYMTLTVNSYATNSPLFVRSSAGYNPSSYSNNLYSGDAYGTSGSINSATTGLSCTTIASRNSGAVATSATTTNYAFKHAEEVALGTLKLASTDLKKERLFVMQLQLYKSLLGANAAIVQESNLLKNFVNNAPQGIKNIVTVEEQIGKANKATTLQLLVNWQPQNLVEENYKQYYGWVAGTPNMEGLLALAKQCPLTNGAVVNYARTLYNYLSHKNIVFANNCSAKLNYGTLAESREKISIYPNPTTGSFKLKLPNAKPNEVVNCIVIVTDIYGKQVLQQHLVQAETQLSIDGAKGIYFITMFNSANGKQTVSKIVLQ